MIFDNLKNAKLYEKALPQIADCVSFVEKVKKESLADGKYEIDGDRLFASVQSYVSKDPAVARTEAHKAYIDLQYVLSGTEEMWCADLDTLTEVEERYSKGSDVAFYEGELTAFTVLSDDCFAVLYPSDAHCPGVMHKSPENMRKIVFKIKL